jgi:hypothetical protein
MCNSQSSLTDSNPTVPQRKICDNTAVKLIISRTGGAK